MILNKNVACVDNLSEQKSTPDSPLFGANLTNDLKDERGNKAKDTWAFLPLFKDYGV